MRMEVETGTSSIQSTLLQDNYIVPDDALQLLHFAMSHGFSRYGTSPLTLQTVVVERKLRSNVCRQTLTLGVRRQY